MTEARAGRRPGPKPRLSRERIIDAAIDVGVDQLSIAAVAEAVDASPAALYRHIGSLDELAAAAIEEILTRTPLPPTASGWRTFLDAEAWTRWDLLIRYSGLIARHGPRLARVAVRRTERLVDTLCELGFTVDDAVLAVDAVVDLIADAAHQAVWLRDPDDPDAVSPEARALFTLYPPRIRTVVEEIAADPRPHVQRKLALVLDGIAARCAPTP